MYWQKESNGIISKLEFGLAGTKGMSIDNPSLTITFASMRDTGLYRCIAINSVGTGESKSANFTVHGGNHKTKIVSDQIQTIVLYAYAILYILLTIVLHYRN